MIDYTKIKVTKLDAARRQLRTAIRLWFNGGDPVSIHALAFAAYEVIHVVSKKRKPNRRDLLFDALIVKDEHRREFNIMLKMHGNFFKHAKNDWNAEIEFAPALSILFLMGAAAGIRLMGERQSVEESALVFWFFIHAPEWLTPDFRKRLEDSIPVKDIAQIRAVTKPNFLKAFALANKNIRDLN